jgi:hypothetical protein
MQILPFILQMAVLIVNIMKPLECVGVMIGMWMMWSMGCVTTVTEMNVMNGEEDLNKVNIHTT